MKKSTLILLAGVLLAQAAFSQTQLPNPNFEDWTTDNNGKDSLIGWSSSNAVAIGMVIPLKKDAVNAYQGNYAAKLITAPFGIVGYTKVSILVNGDATFNWNGGSGYSVEYVSGGGTPISIKPSELKGYYKSDGNARVDVLLSKYNTTLNKRDTISYTYNNILASTTVYTPFIISLPDLIPGMMPDSITTIFYSLNPDPTPPNGLFADLYIDSLTLTEPAPEPAPIADFSASPLNGTIDSIIQFTDNSTGSPTSWIWTITPNTVNYISGTATSQNPNVQFTAEGDYTVKLVATNATGSDSITKTDYIHIVDAPIGIDEILDAENLPVYPNPAKDKLYLEPYCRGADMRIIDIRGRIIASYKKINTSDVDISHITAGVYFIQFQKGKQIQTFKLLIQK